MMNFPTEMNERTGRLMAAAFVLTLVALGCRGGEPSAVEPVSVSVDTDYGEAVPGKSISLIWRFTMAPGWHLYWVGRNDSGFAPTIDLDLPAGWIAGALQWPAPRRHLADGEILDHVYHEELVLLQKVGVPADAPTAGGVTFDARIEWLGCREACMPGKVTVPVTIPLAARRITQRSVAWQAAHDALPRPLPDGLLRTAWDGQTFRLAGERGTNLVFMPSADAGELVNLISDGEGRTLALRFRVRDGIVGPVRGLISIRSAAGAVRSYIVDFPAQVYSPNNDGG